MIPSISFGYNAHATLRRQQKVTFGETVATEKVRLHTGAMVDKAAVETIMNAIEQLWDDSAFQPPLEGLSYPCSHEIPLLVLVFKYSDSESTRKGLESSLKSLIVRKTHPELAARLSQKYTSDEILSSVMNEFNRATNIPDFMAIMLAAIQPKKGGVVDQGQAFYPTLLDPVSGVIKKQNSEPFFISQDLVEYWGA